MAIDIDLDGDGDGDGNGQAWMATFADLSTLLLTFFVLLLSFANVDIVQFRMALGSVKDALGVQFEHPGDIMGMATSPIELSKQESTASLVLVDEVQLLERIKEVVKSKGLTDKIEAALGEKGVIVRVKGKVLFGSGDSDVNPGEGSTTLEAIVELAEAIPFPLSIEGHTDDRPIRTVRYPSNWELSTARATAVMRFLVDGGIDPSRVGVAGYADMRPLVKNDSPANRARNRRVEFIFLTPTADSEEAKTLMHKKVIADVDKLTEPAPGEPSEPSEATPEPTSEPTTEPTRPSEPSETTTRPAPPVTTDPTPEPTPEPPG